MALKITSDCTLCGACEPECPNKAISEGEDVFIIDRSLCTECIGAFDESQCVLVCPADCIFTDDDNPETQEELMEKYKSIHGE